MIALSGVADDSVTIDNIAHHERTAHSTVEPSLVSGVGAQIRRMLCQVFGGSDSPIVEHPSDAVRVALVVHWYRY